MSTETIKRLNDITGQILRSESKIETYKDLINRLNDENVKYSGKLVVQVEKSRYENNFYLNIDEILPAIKRCIREETFLLNKFKEEYDKLK